MNSRLVVSLAAALGLAVLSAPATQASPLDSEAAVDRSERITVADADLSQAEASWKRLPDAGEALASAAGTNWAQGIELNIGGPRRREVEEVEEVERPRRRVVREVEEVAPRRRIVREEPVCRVRVVRLENVNTGRVVVRRIRECD